MPAEIQLQQVKYHGDNPDVARAYENAAYRKDSDIENGSSMKRRQIYEDDNNLGNTDNEDVTVARSVKSQKSGSYEFTNDNKPRGDGDDDVDDDDDDDDNDDNCCTRPITTSRREISSCWNLRKKIWCKIILLVIFLFYLAYFIYAMIYEQLQNEPSIRLCWITCIAIFFIILNLIWPYLTCCNPAKSTRCKLICQRIADHEALISWIIIGLLFAALIIFVLVDVFFFTKQYYNLVSATGIIIYVFLFFIFSYCPAKINWRTVMWGLGLQLLFAVLILKWDAGYQAFDWLGKRVSEFLSFSDQGAEFVFGEVYAEHFFAFKVLPTIVYFSTVISILYYWGVMQVIVKWVAGVMQFAMGTTAGESLNAAGNIFIGQTEAPLMIKPLLPHMTKSELHAVMTGGFATVAGGVLAAYILFGVPANHLLSASVMSAPAALAMAKLLYPETEQSKTTVKDVKKLPKSTEVNFIAAAANGASQSIALVANVAVNLIAFVSLLGFVDSALTWFGHRVGLYDPALTFRLICSYLLVPFAFIMGVEPHDCRHVAELIGVKTFLNEFIAYIDLSKLIKNREALDNHTLYNGTWFWNKDDVIMDPLPGYNNTQTLENGFISLRSEVISTYALCGFANIGSIGVQLGGLGAMAPERRGDLAKIALRAMIAGNVACFMTACIAGLFYSGE